MSMHHLKRSSRQFTARILTLAAALVLPIGAASAQNPVDDNYRKAVQAMEDSKWAEAAEGVPDHSNQLMRIHKFPNRREQSAARYRPQNEVSIWLHPESYCS